MASLFGTLVLGIILFTVSDLDDLLLLLVFFADPGRNAWAVVAGQYVGMGAIYAVSVAVGLLSLVMSPAHLGLLGFGPLAIGAYKLARLAHLLSARPANQMPSPLSPLPPRWGAASVFVTTIANGADNVASYSPVFAAQTGREIATIGAVFFVMTGLWCAAAWRLARRGAHWGQFQRWAGRALPFVLIGLGLVVLWRQGTLALLFGA